MIAICSFLDVLFHGNLNNDISHCLVVYLYAVVYACGCIAMCYVLVNIFRIDMSIKLLEDPFEV
jgi:hypothetical protein